MSNTRSIVPPEIPIPVTLISWSWICGSWKYSLPRVAHAPTTTASPTPNALPIPLPPSRFPFEFRPPLDAFFHRLLIPSLRRLVPSGAAEHLRQVLLGDVGLVVVVRVLVPRAVPQLFHEGCRRIANMQRHGLRGVLARGLQRPAERRQHPIRLGRR